MATPINVALFNDAQLAQIRGEEANSNFTSSAVAAVVGTIPAGGVGAAAGAWDTSVNRDTAIATMTEMRTVINNIRAALAANGIVT